MRGTPINTQTDTHTHVHAQKEKRQTVWENT